MTCKEKLRKEHPEDCDALEIGFCEKCWDREIPEEPWLSFKVDFDPNAADKVPSNGRGMRAKLNIIDEYSGRPIKSEEWDR